jgi:hypothetical protein
MESHKSAFFKKIFSFPSKFVKKTKAKFLTKYWDETIRKKQFKVAKLIFFLVKCNAHFYSSCNNILDYIALFLLIYLQPFANKMKIIQYRIPTSIPVRVNSILLPIVALFVPKQLELAIMSLFN